MTIIDKLKEKGILSCEHDGYIKIICPSCNRPDMFIKREDIENYGYGAYARCNHRESCAANMQLYEILETTEREENFKQAIEEAYRKHGLEPCVWQEINGFEGPGVLRLKEGCYKKLKWKKEGKGFKLRWVND